MTERTIKIKGLISDEVCMGTYGLVELELLEIEKEMEALRQLAVSKSSLSEKYKKGYNDGWNDACNEYGVGDDC